MKYWSYAEVEKSAKAIFELELGEIYLTKGDMPWDLAVSCEPGGGHRLDIATDIWFRGISRSGVSLRWSFDIEPPSANGKATYQIDVAGCREVLQELTDPCRTQFRNYLHDCAREVEKQAIELDRTNNNNWAVVKALQSI